MHTANLEIRECVKWSLTRVKNNGKSLTIRPKKWSRSLTGGLSSTRGSNCKALIGKILVFWIGGRLWEVVEYGGSTVLIYFFTLDDAKGAIYY